MKLFLSLASLLAILAIGCGPSAEKTTTPSDGTFKVALLTPGPVSDAGWSAMAFDGLTSIKSELGAEVSNQEATGTKIPEAMRSYARQGYKLIFGHGYEYNEPAMKVAADFPDTVFVSSSGASTSSNVGAFRFYLEQGFYIAGYMGAKMSNTRVVGMIGGDDVPSIRSTFKAFKAGAEAAVPDVRVVEIFTGNGQDQAAAKKAALSAIDQGADVLIHQANSAARGVFQACEEKGVYAFGANLDQNAESPQILASAVIVAKPAFLALAKSVKDGSYKGGIALKGMADGAIEFKINPKLEAKIPPDVMKQVVEIAAQIKAGKLTVPKDEF